MQQGLILWLIKPFWTITIHWLLLWKKGQSFTYHMYHQWINSYNMETCLNVKFLIHSTSVLMLSHALPISCGYPFAVSPICTSSPIYWCWTVHAAPVFQQLAFCVDVVRSVLTVFWVSIQIESMRKGKETVCL